ncbi:hypothetical protein D9611_013673 [Ephemerocybe angulata]|uniref:Uncharacterized protein n=1 Tax=Ephemerocybe angulata TaxID=980116 RepID=A0A8H5B930_9AGAR|nr:hypothetical protein D9611_013673 [Tulosesus angulatus]
MNYTGMLPHIGRWVSVLRFNKQAGFFTLAITDTTGARRILKVAPATIRMCLKHDEAIGNNPTGDHAVEPLCKEFMEGFNEDPKCHSKFVYRDPLTKAWVVPHWRITPDVLDLDPPFPGHMGGHAYHAPQTRHQPRDYPDQYSPLDRDSSRIRKMVERHDRAFDVLLLDRERNLKSDRQRDHQVQRRYQRRDRGGPHHDNRGRRPMPMKPRRDNTAEPGQDFYIPGTDPEVDEIFRSIEGGFPRNYRDNEEILSPLLSPPSPLSTETTEHTAPAAITVSTANGETLEVGALSLEETARAFDIQPQPTNTPVPSTSTTTTNPRPTTSEALKNLNFRGNGRRRITRRAAATTAPEEEDQLAQEDVVMEAPGATATGNTVTA